MRRKKRKTLCEFSITLTRHHFKRCYRVSARFLTANYVNKRTTQAMPDNIIIFQFGNEINVKKYEYPNSTAQSIRLCALIRRTTALAYF